MQSQGKIYFSDVLYIKAILTVLSLLFSLVPFTLSAQSENWNDTLLHILKRQLPDSIIADEVGVKAYQLIILRKFEEADPYLEQQKMLSMRSKCSSAIAHYYYNLSVRRYGQISIDSVITTLQNGILYAEKGPNTIYTIRLYRTLAQAFENASKLEEAKNLIEKSEYYAKLLKDETEQAKTNLAFGIILDRLEQPRESLKKYYSAIEVLEKLKDNRALAVAYNAVGNLLFKEQDFLKCGEYYFRNLEHCKSKCTPYLPTAYLGVATYYYATKESEQALAYYDSAEAAMGKNIDYRRLHVVYTNKATIYQEKNMADSAEVYHRKTIALASSMNKIGLLGRLYMNFASFLLSVKQLDSAEINVNTALRISTEEGDEDGVKDALRLKGNILFEKGDFVNARNVYERSIIYRDSVALEAKKREISRLVEEYESNKKQEVIQRLTNEQKIQQLELEKKNAIIAGNLQEARQRQSEIDLLNKENLIKELQLKEQQQALRQKMLEASTQEQALALSKQKEELRTQEVTQQKNAKNMIIAGSIVIFLFLLLGFNQYRISQHRKNENERHQLQHQLSELKIEALRAQMNPHFIFNALNSINRYIIRSDKETASDYLVKFSKLMRLVLENSKSSLVTLRNETDALRLYIEMEQLRFDHKFDYSIEIDPTIDREQTMIPPLVLQPYVENAIWHGLLNKGSEGIVHIKVSKAGESQLFCTVEDNGIGRLKAAEMKSRTLGSNKSFGTEITRERIKLLNGDDKNFRIIDLYDAHQQPAGTRVEIILQTEVAIAA